MKNTKKIALSFLIALVLLTSFPQKANAQYVDVGNAIKEYVADTLAYQFENLVVKKITSQTVTWINSGFEGKPAFIENPDEFFLNLADDTAGDFFAKKNLDGLCTPFKAQVRLTLVKNYLSNDSRNYACNLSKLKDNYDQFMQDFSKGGWEGWFEVTQNDANNPFGAYFQAQTNLSRKQEVKKTKYNKQLEYGSGILSLEKCPENETVTEGNIDSWSVQFGKQFKVGDCAGTKQTVTPGSVIGEQLGKVLGGPMERILGSDEVDEILGALLNQLANAAVGGIGKGLRSLSKSSNGQPSTADDLLNDPAEQISNPNAGGDTGPLVTCVNDPATGVMVCKAGKGNGGLSACMSTGTGHGNDAGAPQTIDPTNIVYELTNAASWKIAGKIQSVTADDNLITFAHDRVGAWTPFDVKYVPNDPAFSSPWILIWRKNPDPIIVSQQVKDELIKLLGTPAFVTVPTNVGMTLVKTLYSERVMADKTDSRNMLLVPNGRYFCGNLVSGADTNCIRYRNWQVFIKNAQGILDQIAVIEQDATSATMTRIGPALSDLKSKNEKFLQFMTDTIGNDQDKPLYKQSDYNNLVVKANDLIDSIDQAIVQLNDLINPPPVGSGKWHAIPFNYLTVANPNSREVDYVFCGGINGARTYPDFTPTAGDTYGFMLSTPARDTNIVTNTLNARQKTDIVTYTWPAGIVRPVATGNLPTPTSTGAGPACTQQGTDEQNYMLPLLNGGTPPQQVADMTNTKFSLGYGAQAVYYPNNNTIGLPEFYTAGPTTGRPVSPSTGLPWDVVVRCNNNPTTGGGSGINPPTDALTKHSDQSGTIGQAKADLLAQGVNISGACGAWEIVRLAAKYMGGGAGLLNKPGGNGCNGYAVDIIAYPDGYIYDVLIDAGNNNNPAWNPTACPNASTCPSEYRTAP